MKSKANPNTTSKWYFILGRVLIFCLFSVIILIICSSITNDISVTVKDHLSILSATIFTLLLLLLFLKWEKLTPRDVGIIPQRYSVQRFFSGYIIGFCMAGLQALIILLYGHFQLYLVPNISLIDIISPLFLYFLIACREELAFRSYSLRRLNISFGPLWALTIIGIVFIVEHIAGGMTWKMAILGSGTGAILFGVSALKTKGLALSLGLHSAWNFGQWTFGFKNSGGIFQAVVEKGYESEIENIGLIAFIFVMALAIGGILFYYKSNKLVE